MTKHKNNRALTLIEVLIIFGLLLLIVLIVASIPKPINRHAAKLVLCAANQTNIYRSLTIEEAEGNNLPWDLPPESARQIHFDVLPGNSNGMEPTIDRETPLSSNPEGVHISPTRLMWTMIRDGDNEPENFICRLSMDTPDPTPANDYSEYYDFTAPDNISYGINVSVLYQGKDALAKHAHQVPLVADKSPYTDANQFATPPATLNQSSTPAQWKPYLSQNHPDDGINIVYMDGHLDRLKTPYTTKTLDNIYTTAASCTNSNPLLTGVSMWTARNLPYDWYDPKHNPYAATDALIFP